MAAVTRDAVVAEARTWVGTPFAHQATLKGVACDCGGLARGVSLALGLIPADYEAAPDAQRFMGYARQPDGFSLREACETFMTPIEPAAMQPGDAILVAWSAGPQHVGILAPYRHGGLAIIHATITHGVIETRLLFGTTPAAMKFVSAYRLPGVAA